MAAAGFARLTAAINALAGRSLPAGGVAGAVLSKVTASDYDAAWSPPAADPWNYVVLASDFSTSSASAVDVDGLGFAPAANQRYEFEALLLTRTATTTVGPRPGLAWASGLVDGVGHIFQATSATAFVQVFGNISATLLAAVGGLPNTTNSYPARVSGSFMAGASPSGQVRVQLASETAGTNVTLRAGSYLKYRTLP